MFNVLRLIIIIVTALFVFGWAIAAADPLDLNAEIVLEAMPVRPNRQKVVRYRSPFIVPMTPLDFEASVSLSAPNPSFEYGRPQQGMPGNSFATSELDFNGITLPDVYSSIKTLRQKSATMLVSELQFTPTTIDKVNGRPASKHVAIARPNLQALSERVTLHNLNVAAIEDQLRVRKTWRISDLESIVNQLISLDESSQLWMLYWQLLDSNQRWRAGNPATLSKCVELLSQRIFETQVAVGINRFAVTSLSELAATDRLEKIADNLKAISNPETPSHD